MKTLVISLLLSLSSFAAHAAGEDGRPLFPINTKPATTMSTTAEAEANDPEAQRRHYGNLCCIGGGYYCYLNGYYPIGYSCYCYYRGYYYNGWVCRY